jgi:hypothetical protein
MNDVVVTFLLVHGGQDLINLGADGGVVALSPVQEPVGVSGSGVEVVQASHRHDA